MREEPKRLRFSTAILGIVTILFLTGCDEAHVVTGPVQTIGVSLDKDAVERANVEFNMGTGELKLRGGSEKLIEGRLEFAGSDWKPSIRSNLSGAHATVTIQQPKAEHGINQPKNTWDLQLNDKVLMDLALNCGAGQAQMDLGSLNLRSVQVHMGAGQVDLDLEGHPLRDYDVEIHGGVGQATVHLPHDVGVRAEAHGGIGSVNVTGLTKRGDYYENDLYDSAKVNVRVVVAGGIGEIRLID